MDAVHFISFCTKAHCCVKPVLKLRLDGDLSCHVCSWYNLTRSATKVSGIQIFTHLCLLKSKIQISICAYFHNAMTNLSARGRLTTIKPQSMTKTNQNKVSTIDFILKSALTVQLNITPGSKDTLLGKHFKKNVASISTTFLCFCFTATFKSFFKWPILVLTALHLLGHPGVRRC